MNYLLVSITMAFTGGIWLSGIIAWPLPLLYFLSAGMTLASVIFLLRGDHRVSAAVCAVFFLLGMIHYLHSVQLAANDIGNWAGHTKTVSGEVLEVPQVIDLEDGKIRVRYVVAAKNVLEQGQTAVASGGMMVYVKQAKDVPIAQIDDQLTAVGTIVLPAGYHNPGLVDTVAGLKRQGITARMSAIANTVHIQSNGPAVAWKTRLANWRQTMTANMQKVMPPADAAVLTGMLFGGYTGIKTDVVQDFAATGIVHILSVSGSHIALVAGVLLWVGKRLHLRFWMIVMLVTGSILFYGCLSGFTPPVVRSVAMGIVALAAVGFGREKDGPSALAVVVLGMLVYQPALIYDISFQLSTGATAGILFFYSRTVKQLAFLPDWLRSAMAVTWSAQIGVIPFIAWYFNTVSLSSFPANLLVVPIIELLVVMGLAGTLLSLLLPPLGSMILVICSLLTGLAILLTSGLAALPGGTMYLPPFTITGGLVYYLLLAWLYGYCPANLPRPLQVIQWVWRSYFRIGGFITVATVCFWFGFLCPKPVGVHFIDVGQGDSTLITTPHGRAILVDTGGVMGDSAAAFDVGERVVFPYLRHYGILSLDYLILTHGHQDHAGGAAGVSRHMPVRQVMLAREEYAPPVQLLLHEIGCRNIIPMYEGQRILIDGVAVDVLHAVESLGASGNEVSCVVRVSYGNHSFLLTGDLETQGELAMLHKGTPLESTILKVGHHGAKKSTTPAFLQAVDPAYAVISVGSNNRFGHPHAETLNRLVERQIPVYRTDQQGAIAFYTDGNVLTVEPFWRGDHL
ncbi:MAG: internalization-related competence protein ComEC/Rec2 [Firmicutes bacterium]|nr:internalization-related competence protein ComEC/Rec2 [Bacillota bacterium]